MRKLCPVCNGKGRVPDPTIEGPWCYAGPNGERWPMVICQNCWGEGWVGVPDNPGPAKPKPIYTINRNYTNEYFCEMSSSGTGVESHWN